MISPDNNTIEAKNLDIPLDRDVFLRDLLRSLSGTLEDIVGVEEASGFISVVGQQIGARINALYKSEFGVAELDRTQVADTLVDLKRRIDGDFYVIEEDDEKIVFGNRTCPFGDKVNGRPSLCMMTSNVFGSIAADNLGYSKVELQETIANGDAGCKVVVYTKQTEACDQSDGREYYKS